MRKVLFILGQLDDRDIEWMLAKGHRQELSAGTVLIQQGQTVDTVSIVLTGLLSVSICSPTAGDQELSRLGAGEMVGEMSFIDARPPSATVRAVENTLVFAIPKDQLAIKLADDTAFAARFYRI